MMHDDDLIPVSLPSGGRLYRAACALRYCLRPLRRAWLRWRSQWADFWQVW